MGIEWLSRITQTLNDAGIRAGEGFPPGRQTELTGTVAAVGLRDLNCREGTAEFEIRILSPRELGGWHCQSKAAEAVTALEAAGVECRMEPMSHRSGSDCFELMILGKMRIEEQEVIPQTDLFRITIWDITMAGVAEFSAVQERGRRMIGTLNQKDPVGVTQGNGGWKLKMVQQIPDGGVMILEPEEPFSLKVYENGLVTSFHDCYWDSVAKVLDQNRSRLVWEGFAMRKTEGIE